MTKVAQNEVAQEWGNNINSNSIMENKNKAQSDKDDKKLATQDVESTYKLKEGKKRDAQWKKKIFLIQHL